LRILVVGSCGKKKRSMIPNAPRCGDLLSRRDFTKWRKRLSMYSSKARDMYVGSQPRELTSAVDLLRSIKGVQVDYHIVSAGFGLLGENDIVPPYDCSFTGMRQTELVARASLLAIEHDFRKACRSPHDFSYFALGSEYMTALGSSWKDVLTGKLLTFHPVVAKADVVLLPCSAATVKALSSVGHKIHGVTGYKGDLLRILAEYALERSNPSSEILSWINAGVIEALFDRLSTKTEC
jgi:hypothetical protein